MHSQLLQQSGSNPLKRGPTQTHGHLPNVFLHAILESMADAGAADLRQASEMIALCRTQFLIR